MIEYDQNLISIYMITLNKKAAFLMLPIVVVFSMSLAPTLYSMITGGVPIHPLYDLHINI